MPSLVLAGVLDHDPQPALRHDGPDLRRALAAWLGGLVPGLDPHRDDPQAIEGAWPRRTGPRWRASR